MEEDMIFYRANSEYSEKIFAAKLTLIARTNTDIKIKKPCESVYSVQSVYKTESPFISVHLW
jgi:hypothetical protein